MFSTNSTHSTGEASAKDIKQPRNSLTTHDAAQINNCNHDDDDDDNYNMKKRHCRPFEGVVACLTGMSPSLKSQYHDWIEALGGSFTRDFHTSRNTHLIAEHPTGEKYETAMALQQQKRTMYVVQPSWLQVSYQDSFRAKEEDHSWCGHSLENSTANDAAANTKDTQRDASIVTTSSEYRKRKHKESGEKSIASLSPSKKRRHAAIQKQHLFTTALTQALSSSDLSGVIGFPNPLFSSCHFYLVGFDTDSHEQRQFCKLLRRGMGTIYWEYQDGITTHVIVHDQCDDATRESISKAKVEVFGNYVTVVSPSWALQSWQAQQFQSPLEYPADLQIHKKSSRTPHHNKRKTTGTLKNKNADKSSNLFRGYFFVLLRTSNPPRWMVDYDSKELDKLIRTHNGQILSLKLLEALKADSIKQSYNKNDSSIVKRKCHVVCWGGGAAVSDNKNRQGNNLLLQQQFALHPLLSQIQRRNLCELVVVNPNWLQTCVAEQKVVDHNSLPLLFQPQSWPWRKMYINDISNNGQDDPEIKKQPVLVNDKENDSTADPIKGNSNNNNRIINPKKSAVPRISVTGFVGSTRAAIVQAILAMGATFDDSMHQHKTTHLICAETVIAQQRQQQPDKKNQKLLKAREWGIHAVSFDWLYHVLQFGGGKNKKAPGDNDEDTNLENYDEARFAVCIMESHNS